MHKKIRKPTVKYRKVGFSENQKIRIPATDDSIFPGSKFLGLFAFLFLATLFLGFNYFIYSSENQKKSSQSVLGMKDQVLETSEDLISEISMKDELEKDDYYRLINYKLKEISQELEEIKQVKLELNAESDAYKAVKLELETSKRKKQEALEELKKIKNKFEEQMDTNLEELMTVEEKLFVLGV
jgi:chromosome segregation ATPase